MGLIKDSVTSVLEFTSGAVFKPYVAAGRSKTEKMPVVVWLVSNLVRRMRGCLTVTWDQNTLMWDRSGLLLVYD